jgi:hypothetical protein
MDLSIHCFHLISPFPTIIAIYLFAESDAAKLRVVSAEVAGCTIMAAAAKMRAASDDRRIMRFSLRENRTRCQFSVAAADHC